MSEMHEETALNNLIRLTKSHEDKISLDASCAILNYSLHASSLIRDDGGSFSDPERLALDHQTVEEIEKGDPAIPELIKLLNLSKNKLNEIQLVVDGQLETLRGKL